MQVGYRERFWFRNCAAIGLSQGFVEPLEATGLLMFDATARMLAEQFPASRALMPLLSERFNRRVGFAWERVIDFIKLHYCISDRDDTAFWRDNRDPATIPAGLQENLQLWRHQLPSEYDFSSKLEIFNLENYLYVLYGMNYVTELEPLAYRYRERELALRTVQETQSVVQEARKALLPHRELINRIHRYGLQPV
jgi:tryptophan halogenase